METGEIERFITWMFEKYHARRIREQEEDQLFYDDEFPTSIKEPFHTIRTGTAARIIDNIVSHMEVANPRVFRSQRKNTVKEKESNLKVSILLNNWADLFIPQLTEAIWCASLRGEGLFKIWFNPEAYDKNYVFNGNICPIILTSPDPLNVACFPYDSLIPERVCEMFRMESVVLQNIYPAWKPKEKDSKQVDYKTYYDDKTRFLSAGGAELINQSNALKFVPYVHFYSGFGKLSPTGDPSTMAVGRLRKIRGRLKEECEIESRIDSIIGLYANPILQILQTQKDAEPSDKEELKKTVLAPGYNVVTGYGWNQIIYTPQVANAQLFAHLASVRAALGLEDPPIMSGMASTSRSTGRQEDIEFEHIRRKYIKLVNNARQAYATVLGMGLKILYEQPKALPIAVSGTVIDDDGKQSRKEVEITKDDIDGYFACEVKLDPEEALEDDRNFMKNRMLINEGRISWRRFLIDGCGKTEGEADEIMAETLAEQAIMNNALMRAAREEEAIKQMGAERYIEQAKQDAALQQKMQQALQERNNQPQRARPSEAPNPMAMQTVRRLLGGETPIGVRPSPTAVVNNV